MITDQARVWRSEFGQAYTARGPKTIQDFDTLYEAQFGLRRSELNERFLGDLDRSISILEIGTNVGGQLHGLKAMGFRNLVGIDLDLEMVSGAQTLFPHARFALADLLHLPFRNGAFDLVFTSGVLIHIAGSELDQALDEIHRCARRYIWGWEYYAEERTEITYRGHRDFVWKEDFAGRYATQFPNLALVRQERVPYLEGDNVDSMFLLEKKRV